MTETKSPYGESDLVVCRTGHLISPSLVGQPLEDALVAATRGRRPHIFDSKYFLRVSEFFRGQKVHVRYLNHEHSQAEIVSAQTGPIEQYTAERILELNRWG